MFNNHEPGTRNQELPISTSKEIQLLLLCSRIQFGTADIEEISNIAISSLNRSVLIRLARSHHVLPILYQTLKKAAKTTNEEFVPQKILDELKDMYLRIAAHNVYATENLFQILDFLESRKIKAVPVKGPVLAKQTYGSISMRQFSDLDLVISQKDLLTAIKSLCQTGYSVARPPKGTNRTAYLKTRQDWILSNTDGSIVLDIKPAVISHTIARPFLTDALVKNSVPLAMDDSRCINAPSPETMLLVVCIHGVHETWAGLSQVADVAGLVANPNLDWPGLLEIAQSWRQMRTLLTGLCLCSKTLGVNLPQEVTHAIEKDITAKRIADAAFRDLVSPAHIFSVESKTKWRMERATRDTFVDMLRCAMRQFMTPSMLDLNAVNLPPVLFFLYTPVRLLRLGFGVLFKKSKKENYTGDYNIL